MPPFASSHSHRSANIWIGAAALLTVAGGSAIAAFTAGNVDLQTATIRLDGAAPGDALGSSIAAAGDFNGDGRGDLVVGAPGAGRGGIIAAGAAFVIYGQPGFTSVDVANLGTRGIRIDGMSAGDRLGQSVSTAGDVNGDGRADVIVGAPGFDAATDRVDTGAAYVIYGQVAGGNVDLGALGARGVRVDGATADDQLGGSVTSVGDTNGDGRGDLLVGAAGADRRGRTESGAAFLILGQQTPTNLDLQNAPAARAVAMDGAASEDTTGTSVAGAGDVNADGRQDMLIGANLADRPGAMPAATGEDAGAAYVVFGAATPANVDLNATDTASIRINGSLASDSAGFAVTGVGDVNGDGRADVAVGAPGVDLQLGADSGATYVVYGRAGAAGAAHSVDLGALGGEGLTIEAGRADDRGGSALSAGDLNRDGRVDLLVGAPNAKNNNRSRSGSGYLLFGQQPWVATNLATNTQQMRLDGAAASDEAATAMAAADVDGDGTLDLAVGTPGADQNGRLSSGSVSLILNALPAPPPPTPGPTPPPAKDPRIPDTTGIKKPFVLRAGPVLLVASKEISGAALRKEGCVKMRVQSSAVGSAAVLIRPNVRKRSAALGQKVAPFATPGARPVCVKFKGLKDLKKFPPAVRVSISSNIGGAKLSASRVVLLKK